VIHFLSLSKVIKSQPGWYPGDFHAHSNFSDGKLPILQLINQAKSTGLDFFALTDHNTIDGLHELFPVSNILIIPGLEVTLAIGHFNVLGVKSWHDWMESICVYPYNDTPHSDENKPSTTEIMVQSSRSGLINCIVHPLSNPWKWKDYQTNLNFVHCIEICNNPAWLDNDIATIHSIRWWTGLLNAGYRITALGGSDYHQHDVYHKYREPERINFPTTYVYAEELSCNAILSAVLRRRVYISLGPVVSFQAEVNGIVHGIGQDVGLFDGEIKFTSTISQLPEVTCIQIIKNGEVIAEKSTIEGETQLLTIDSVSSSQSNWYRLDVYDSNGAMLAITNPIFVGRRKRPNLTTFGEVYNLAFPEHETQDFP
jgi:hypothetical protein